MPQFRADIDVTSKASTTAQGVLIGTQTTMPAPSINNVGCTVKYTGTAGTYTPGRYYTCVQSGSGYIWQEAETIATGLDLDTGSRAVVTDGSGMAAVSNVTSTELGYLDGVTSGIQSQLNGKVPTNRTINGHALTGNVTLKISDLENDSGFITSTVSNLSNYYTKTQTYTKTEVDSRLDAINSMNVSVVSTLPQTGDPHTIYLVPKSASGSDAHQEYLYVSGKWELIGDTSVDLSNYYTKAEVNSRDVSSASWSSNALRIYHTDGTYESAAPSGAASTVMTSNLSTSKVVVTNSSGKLAASSTITTTELGYLNGVTSSIQTQLNNKVPTSRTINGHALTGNITLTQSDLGIDIPEINVTANRAVVSNSTGALTASAVTSTELSYLDRVKSNIQDQLDDKQATITGGASTIASTNLSANRALVSNASGKVAVSTVTAAQLGYLSEVTSSIQDQLDNKADADTEITGGALSVSGSGTDSLQITLTLNNGVKITSNTFSRKQNLSGTLTFINGWMNFLVSAVESGIYLYRTTDEIPEGGLTSRDIFAYQVTGWQTLQNIDIMDEVSLQSRKIATGYAAAGAGVTGNSYSPLVYASRTARTGTVSRSSSQNWPTFSGQGDGTISVQGSAYYGSGGYVRKGGGVLQSTGMVDATLDIEIEEGEVIGIEWILDEAMYGVYDSDDTDHRISIKFTPISISNVL